MRSTSSNRDRRDRAWAGATRFAMGEAPLIVSERLRRLADAAQSQVPDLYGESGDLAELEREVARLLGKPAAVFMPSGTMAQQCALRVWTDRTGHPVVALHGLSHLVRHEENALEVLHGVRMEQLTSERRPLTEADLTSAPGPFGALCVELPLRDAGYLLPSWENLVALAGAARDRRTPVHLDGARLWESQPFYGRSHAEIAAIFDSIYVSFYKGLGGIAGAALAGPQDVIDACRQWQHRHGGTLYSLYPYAVAARLGLQRLDQFSCYAERARALAAGLAEVPGLRVHPWPPHTNAFVMYADVPASDLEEAALQLAEASGTWALGRVAEGDVPGWAATEVVVGPATLEWPVAELVELLTALVERARKLET
ncbi:MAG TPA: beta-eliminating lyase-related protein [Actinomycetales bacterium]|nr:beta-eliminating lyase-related protein [Actinomycetales bacterium]